MESCQEQNETEVYCQPEAPMSMQGKGLTRQQNLNQCASLQAAKWVKVLRRVKLPQNQDHINGASVCLEHVSNKSTEKRHLNVQKTCRLTLMRN